MKHTPSTLWTKVSQNDLPRKGQIFLTSKDSPEIFLSRLDATIADPAEIGSIKTAVIRAIGIRDEVRLIADLELRGIQGNQCHNCARYQIGSRRHISIER